MKDAAGREWSTLANVHKTFINFYEHLFSSGEVCDVEDCLLGLEERVTPSMNSQLLAEFKEEEVEAALGQMHPLKAPGLTALLLVSTKSRGA